MSENGNKKVSEFPSKEQPLTFQPNSELYLFIEYDNQTGQIVTKGCLNQTMIAYGMLETAKDAVRIHQARSAMARQKAAAANIVLPKGPLTQEMIDQVLGTPLKGN
jgi:hypothetical protein